MKHPILAVLAVGCAVRLVPVAADTAQCQWVWITDRYGGYQQLQCWRPDAAAWHPFVHPGGAPLHAYPTWYSGPRTYASPPPRFAPPVPLARPAPVAPPPPGPRTVVIP